MNWAHSKEKQMLIYWVVSYGVWGRTQEYTVKIQGYCWLCLWYYWTCSVYAVLTLSQTCKAKYIFSKQLFSYIYGCNSCNCSSSFVACMWSVYSKIYVVMFCVSVPGCIHPVCAHKQRIILKLKSVNSIFVSSTGFATEKCGMCQSLRGECHQEKERRP